MLVCFRGQVSIKLLLQAASHILETCYDADRQVGLKVDAREREVQAGSVSITPSLVMIRSTSRPGLPPSSSPLTTHSIPLSAAQPPRPTALKKSPTPAPPSSPAPASPCCPERPPPDPPRMHAAPSPQNRPVSQANPSHTPPPHRSTPRSTRPGLHPPPTVGCNSVPSDPASAIPDERCNS